jgi:hypothetical protein
VSKTNVLVVIINMYIENTCVHKMMYLLKPVHQHKQSTNHDPKHHFLIHSRCLYINSLQDVLSISLRFLVLHHDTVFPTTTVKHEVERQGYNVRYVSPELWEELEEWGESHSRKIL